MKKSLTKLKTISMEWTGHSLILIDQRKLPHIEEHVECKSHTEVADAIKKMVVRGAPAIGAAAAFGYVLGVEKFRGNDKRGLKEHMLQVKQELATTRPTAVNLFWALNRMEKLFERLAEDAVSKGEIFENLESEALKIAYEDIETNKSIGRYGAELLPEEAFVITHCNAGALATVDYGTAIGVIRCAKEMGKRVHAYVDETRPYLQGARLTTWELLKLGIDTTLISDNMAGWVLKTRRVDAIIVGADRIAANGDVANKIGTYSLAVLANRHGVPVYVAAPTSTLDLHTPTGKEIPIEERSHREVTHCHTVKIAPEGVKVFNPAFDVTEHELVSAIITEKGVVRPPYRENLRRLFEE